MKLLQLTLDSPAANVALDEALLETAELTDDYPEILRIWEPAVPMVVMGRSSPHAQEVILDVCRENHLEVLRRCSGGQSIVTGPGCLMYAVLLDYRQRRELRMLERVHKFVMGQMRTAISRLDINVEMQGTSDLTYQGRKFSGNALRCKRNWLIYHGTMLCEFDIDLVAKCLGKPIREPEYRQSRTHEEFLVQLPTTTRQLANALIQQWAPTATMENWPREMTQQLVTEKYAMSSWTFKMEL